MRRFRSPVIVHSVFLLILFSATLSPAWLSSAQAPSATPTSSGQVLTVTKLADTDDGVCDASDCSLREAIKTAPSGSTIIFKPGLSGTIGLTGEISIDKKLAIVGPGPKSSVITLSSLYITLVFAIQPSASLEMTNLTFANTRSISGAIRNDRGTVTVNSSTFIGNSGNNGGSIWNNGGTVIINNSTFQANHGTTGGAIDNEKNGVLSVTNSTFQGNSATNGGVVFNFSGTTSILHSTFEGNSATEANIFWSRGGSFKVSSTILVGILPSGTNCVGTITDGGDNVQTQGTNCGVSISIGDPKLAPLQDNGGPTFTMELLPGSDAIGKVSKEKCLTVDQRGATLGQQTACDVGAFQHGGNLAATALDTATATPAR
jgi:CSLREA domain-containing protein